MQLHCVLATYPWALTQLITGLSFLICKSAAKRACLKEAMLGLLRKNLAQCWHATGTHLTSLSSPGAWTLQEQLRVFDLHGACIGQDGAGSGKAFSTFPRGRDRLSFAGKTLALWTWRAGGGELLETTPSCPLGWLREEQLRVGRPWGGGRA